MWASCCNWLCLDSSPGEESGGGGGGVSGSGSGRHQAYTNSGYSSYPSPTTVEHTCKACGGRFDTLARKHVCMDCKKNFCGRCFNPRILPRLCHTCQRLCATIFLRPELMKLKVKDLRDYLHLHEVSTQTCREKEELVELVLGLRPAQPTPGAPPPPPPPPPPQQHTHTHARAPPSGSHTHHHTHHHHTHHHGPQPNGQPAPTTTTTGRVPTGATVTQPRAEPLRPPTPGQDDSQSSDTEEVLVPGRRASLSDLSTVEDIDALSVRQLKEILARNFVDYKGCCEKWELMERVTRLYHDQKDLQNLVSNASDGTDVTSGPVVEENLCKICMDSPIDCVLLECGHMVTCTKCGKRMSECPICRQYVVRAVHVFRS
ncbi:E3 ubiquitin-protein ligase rififylin isoform X2 [Sardina pilchardus]|uniref:E3 ubiquitin-protein ligase rififylin isoform X2 n=1 Tax=Sardina pilchardus TaxID=27697 RepID=UPI002E10D9EA